LYLTSGQEGTAEAAFERALQLGGPELEASEQARLRRGLARALIGQGELEQAADALARALEEAEAADDVELERTVVGDLLAVQYSLGSLERVLELSKHARRLAESRGDHIEAAMQREIAIKVLLRLERHEKALVLLHESLDYVRRRGPRRKKLVLMMELGKVNFDLGRLEESESVYQEALEEAQEQSNPRAMAVVLGRLGALYAERGELEAALRYGELALDKVDAETAPDVVAEQHVLLALTYRDLGQFDSAVAAAEKASELYAGLENEEMALGARQLLEELSAAV
ncbi:MAG: tetratricopeptide repeat protein, partial [Anaerolineales bacterium]|nr:tetratricopeptide repeat protein [Anaerolineales bacterium]